MKDKVKALLLKRHSDAGGKGTAITLRPKSWGYAYKIFQDDTLVESGEINESFIINSFKASDDVREVETITSEDVKTIKASDLIDEKSKKKKAKKKD